MEAHSPGQPRPAELGVVAALRTLSIFGPDQGGAYREHFAQVASALGDDVPTKLAAHAIAWAVAGTPGALILTGNAGTGKTAVADAWCQAVGGRLPLTDEPTAPANGRLVIKDLSGLPDLDSRARAMLVALDQAEIGQSLVCANEGVLRDVAEETGREPLLELLEDALRHGAAERAGITVVNLNRQRPTSEDFWELLIDFVAREELWEPGCDGCPAKGGSGCPFRANAAALRRPEPRAALRQLVQLGAGEAVPTMREVLAVLAWALVGGGSCEQAKKDDLLRGASAHTADGGYFHRAVGGGLRPEVAERSPLLTGIRAAGLGSNSDLQVDEWLRDASTAPAAVRTLAGAPEDPESRGPLAGTRSPHDRVVTGLGAMTFHALGETLSTSENVAEVDACLAALVGRGGDASRQALWRQRVYFESPGSLGGPGKAARLLSSQHLPRFLELAGRVARGEDWFLDLAELVGGLNFLVCGFSSAAEGLLVPDQACLFARDPGSFRPARPSLVYGQVTADELSLTTPDRGLVEELLDIDHLEIELVALGEPQLTLRIRASLYQAIQEAAAFQGPVGQGTAEMTDVRGFYGRLASRLPAPQALRVADPQSSPPSLQSLTLPHL